MARLSLFILGLTTFLAINSFAAIFEKDDRKLVQNTDTSLVAVLEGPHYVDCTGVAIGQNFILTAASCIFNLADGKMKENLSFVPYLNQENHVGARQRFFPKSAYLHKEFLEKARQNIYIENYIWADIAVVKVRELQGAPLFDQVATPKTVRSEIAKELVVKPTQFVSYEEHFNSQVAHNSCSIQELVYNDGILYHTCDGDRASLGAPLIQNNKIVGINVYKGTFGTFNRAVNITLPLLDDLRMLFENKEESMTLLTKVDGLANSSRLFRTLRITNFCDEDVLYSVRYFDLDGVERYQTIYNKVRQGRTRFANIKTAPYIYTESGAKIPELKLFAKTVSGKILYAGGQELKMNDGSTANHSYISNRSYVDDPVITLCD